MPSTSTGRSSLVPFPSKPRVFILTDLSNEPDDEESLCRYLTYANQFRTEGIVAVTSTWLRDRIAPDRAIGVIDAYAEVVHNLNAHVHPEFSYPSAEALKALVKRGPPVSLRRMRIMMSGQTGSLTFSKTGLRHEGCGQ